MVHLVDWRGPSYVGLYMTMAYAGINFIQPPPPPPPPTPQQTLGTTWREQKPFCRDNHFAQKSSSRNKINRESKAPPVRQSIYKRISVKLSHYLKWKALWSQQIKRFFNEETILIVIAYIIWQSPDSNYWTYKSYTSYPTYV